MLGPAKRRLLETKRAGNRIYQVRIGLRLESFEQPISQKEEEHTSVRALRSYVNHRRCFSVEIINIFWVKKFSHCRGDSGYSLSRRLGCITAICSSSNEVDYNNNKQTRAKGGG